jgi:uridine kinase
VDYGREIQEIVRDLAARGDGARRLIGIDGPGAPGRRTLATELAGALGGTLVGVDDFSLPPARRSRGIADHYDWRRLEHRLLLPVAAGRATLYQRYDRAGDALDDWHDVPAGRPVIVEGPYVLRPGVRTYFTYRIWVEAPREARLPRDEAYAQRVRPAESANRCVTDRQP